MGRQRPLPLSSLVSMQTSSTSSKFHFFHKRLDSFLFVYLFVFNQRKIEWVSWGENFRPDKSCWIAALGMWWTILLWAETTPVDQLPFFEKGLISWRSVRIPGCAYGVTLGCVSERCFHRLYVRQSTGMERSLLFKIGGLTTSCLISSCPEYWGLE